MQSLVLIIIIIIIISGPYRYYVIDLSMPSS